MTQRIISGAVAVTYVVTAYFAMDAEQATKIAIFLVLPLALIWFSEEMGEYTGFAGGTRVSAPTPGCLVAAGGWVLLLLPLAYGLILFFARGQ